LARFRRRARPDLPRESARSLQIRARPDRPPHEPGIYGPEIAERLQLPSSLANQWANHEYYGTVRHNAKAIYRKYLGWYDDNPANLDPLPPVEAAKKYVAYMGGADTVIRRAREDFRKGEYRFVAEVANQLVFADPTNQEARDLAADAYEQLGYLAESATWRSAYLYGAYELRHGAAKVGRGPPLGTAPYKTDFLTQKFPRGPRKRFAY